MNIKICKGYKGNIERIKYIIDTLSEYMPELKGKELTVDGGRAWGKGIYISDCLFTIRIYTADNAYEYDNINGLRVYEPNFFSKQLQDAKDCLNGINNHFTIEQAKSFLEYNK